MSVSLRRLRLSTKFGLVTLIGMVILSASLATAAIFRISSEMERQAIDRQNSNMQVAWAMLMQRGNGFSIRDGQLFAGEYKINGNFEVVDKVQELVGGTATIFMGDTRVATNVKKPDGSRAVGTQLAKGAAYDSVFRDKKPYRGKADILGETYYTGYDPILNASGEVIGVLYVGLKQSDFFRIVGAVRNDILMISVLVILIVGGFVFVVGAAQFKPLAAMKETMNKLAGGELAVTIPGLDRADEIGDMAHAVEVFKEGLERSRNLEAENQEAQRRSAIRGQRREELTTEFDGMVTRMLGKVSETVVHVRSTATNLREAADTTTSQSSTMAAAADHATSSVQTVAAAAEELSASVQEISRQVQETTRISQEAVSGVEQAGREMERLASAAQKIGEIVKLINDIANQTNLLALNATIEAARAGEAGKGFAVVAGEVKNLANQTAKATGEIGQQISEVQSSTNSVVAVIRGVAATISNVDSVIGSIAGSVQQQGEATSEIASSVQQAAAGSGEVSARIGGVSEAAKRTENMADSMLGVAGSLQSEADNLRSQVENFLSSMRAV